MAGVSDRTLQIHQEIRLLEVFVQHVGNSRIHSTYTTYLKTDTVRHYKTNRPVEPRASQQEIEDIRGRQMAPAAVAAASHTHIHTQKLYKEC